MVKKQYNPKQLLKKKKKKPGRRTLCDTIRDIYWKTNDPAVKAWCEEAIVYARKMNDKLAWYHSKYKQGGAEDTAYK